MDIFATQNGHIYYGTQTQNCVAERDFNDFGSKEKPKKLKITAQLLNTKLFPGQHVCIISEQNLGLFVSKETRKGIFNANLGLLYVGTIIYRHKNWLCD